MSNDENYNNLFGQSEQKNLENNNNQTSENQQNQNEYTNENYEKLFGQQQVQNNNENNYQNFFDSNTQIDKNVNNSNNNIDNNNNIENNENQNNNNIEEQNKNEEINTKSNINENNENNIQNNNDSSSKNSAKKDALNIPVYIASCKLTHINNIPLVYYLLKGNLVYQDIYRRYTDFELLREKLVEIYPCIFIPGLPPKRILGNQDTKISDMKIKLLNHFLKKLTENKELLQSPITKIFLTKDPNFRFNLDRLKRGNPKEINENFKQTFVNFNKNEFKYEESTKFIDYFVKVILATKPRLDVK
jgi:hypothetical protein